MLVTEDRVKVHFDPRRFVLVDDIPRGDTAVYVFLEMVALGFVFAAIDTAVAGKRLLLSIALFGCAVIFFFAGIKWPTLKRKVISLFTKQPKGLVVKLGLEYVSVTAGIGTKTYLNVP